MCLVFFPYVFRMRFIKSSLVAFAVVSGHLGGDQIGNVATAVGGENQIERDPSLKPITEITSKLNPADVEVHSSNADQEVTQLVQATELLGAEDQEDLADQIITGFKNKQKIYLNRLREEPMKSTGGILNGGRERELERVRKDAAKVLADLEDESLSEAEKTRTKELIEKIKQAAEAEIERISEFYEARARKEPLHRYLNLLGSFRLSADLKRFLNPLLSPETDPLAQKMSIEELRAALPGYRNKFVSEHADMTPDEIAEMDKIFEAVVDLTHAYREYTAAKTAFNNKPSYEDVVSSLGARKTPFSFVKTFRRKGEIQISKVAGYAAFPDRYHIEELRKRELTSLNEAAAQSVMDIKHAGLSADQVAQGIEGIEKVKKSTKEKLEKHFEWEMLSVRKAEAATALREAIDAFPLKNDIERMLQPFDERLKDLEFTKISVENLKESLAITRKAFRLRHSGMTDEEKSQLDTIIAALLEKVDAWRAFWRAVAK